MSKAESNRILVEQIEEFVARMPEPVTAREAVKRELRADRQAGKDVQSIAPSHQVEREIQKGKDNGRNR